MQQGRHHRRYYPHLTAQLTAQLEAEPVRNNEQLWHMQVRSRDIDWSRYVRPLDTGVRGRAVYLDTQVYYMNDHRRPQTMQNRRELLICHDMMGNYLADR